MLNTELIQSNIPNDIYRMVMFNYNSTVLRTFEIYVDDEVEITTDINGSTVSITIEINKSDGTRYDKRIQNHQ